VLLALVFPWEITRRVVTRGVPRMARMLGNGGARTSKAIGGGARRVAAALAFIGSMALDTRSTKTVRISSLSRSREPGTTSGA